MIRSISILLFGIFYASFTLAQVDGLEFRLLNSRELDLSPGNTSNLVIQISNNNDTLKECFLKITSPEGWNQLMKYTSLKIEANSSSNKILSFHIPESTTVGEYSISIEAFEKATSASIGITNIPIKVLPRYELVLKKFASPDNVIAGDTFKVKYLIQNQSNLEAKIKTKISNGYRTEEKLLTLAPDSFIITTVVAPTKKSLEYHMRRNVIVMAEIVDAPETQKSLSDLYNIIPSHALKFDPYVRFPIKISTVVASNNQREERGYAAMFEITGNNQLSRKRNDNLSFRLRGPNRDGKPILGTNDSYHALYQSEHHSILVGDNNYRLTDLTESSRFGRGAKYEYKKNKMTFGTFANIPRFYPGLKMVNAAYAIYNVDQKYIATAGHLMKSYADGSTAHISTIAAIARVKSWGNFETEISSGLANGKFTKAYKANLKANYSIFRSYFNITKADEDFPGYFSNTQNLSGGLNLHVFKKANLAFFYTSSKSNIALDTMFSNAPYTSNIDLAVRFRLHRNHSLSLGVVKRSSEDRLQVKLFHFEESTAKIALSHSLNQFRINLSAEVGKVNNFLSQTEGELTNSKRASINIKYMINDKFNFRTFVNYMGNRRYLSSDLNDFYYGAEVYAVWNKFNISGAFQSNYQLEEYYKDRSICDLSFRYTINKKHEISGSTYYNLVKNTLNKKELQFLVKYTYTFNAPLRKKDNLGSLTGRIINKGVDKIEGVVLTYAGSVAITNKKGEFNFPMVRAGTSNLYIDDSKMGLHSIADRPGPYAISIIPGEENVFEISYTKSASISGKLIIENDDNIGAKEYIGVKEKIKNLIIEVKTDEEMYRVITDKNGNYIFKDLRPGSWTLKVYDNGIPSGYELITDTFNAELVPSQEKTIDIKIKKKARKVKFQKSFSSTPKRKR